MPIVSMLDVAMSIPHLISLEISGWCGMLRGGSFAALRQCALVPVIGMEVIVYMTSKVLGAMKPRTGADEDAIAEPLRTVVSIRSAAIGRDIVIAIRTYGSNTDFDPNLSFCSGSSYCHAETGESGQSEQF
jgi:hypothetical protein